MFSDTVYVGQNVTTAIFLLQCCHNVLLCRPQKAAAKAEPGGSRHLQTVSTSPRDCREPQSLVRTRLLPSCPQASATRQSVVTWFGIHQNAAHIEKKSWSPPVPHRGPVRLLLRFACQPHTKGNEMLPSDFPPSKYYYINTFKSFKYCTSKAAPKSSSNNHPTNVSNHPTSCLCQFVFYFRSMKSEVHQDSDLGSVQNGPVDRFIRKGTLLPFLRCSHLGSFGCLDVG